MKKLKYIPLVCVFLLGILIWIISSFEEASEWWTVHISSIYIFLIGSITNLLPFSLFEVTVLFFVLVGVFLLFRLIASFFTKNGKYILKCFYKVFMFAMILLLSYQGIAGIAYHRKEVDILQYNEENITPIFVSDCIQFYLDDYNSIASILPRDEKNALVCPYSYDELASLVQKEMEKLDSPYFYTYTGKPKATFLSPILSELHITGINFAFTAEANVNTAMPWMDLPFTMAHELAHLKGVLREDDANLTALSVLLTSDVPFLRYSAYFRSFFRLLEIKALTNYDEYERYYKQIHQNIFLDNFEYSDYFQEHDILTKISDFFNDLYLKFHGQEEGTHSYVDTSDFEDSGEQDDSGHPIYTYISYSPYQKFMFANYASIQEAKNTNSIKQ